MRTLTVTALLSVLSLSPVLAACDGDGGNGQEDDVDEQRNDEILAGIADRLERPVGGFTKFQGSYRDDASAVQEVAFSIRCDACDEQAVTDAVMKAVWTSEVGPLRTISVHVTGPDGYHTDRVSLADEEDELIEKYGEQPAG